MIFVSLLARLCYTTVILVLGLFGRRTDGTDFVAFVDINGLSSTCLTSNCGLSVLFERFSLTQLSFLNKRKYQEELFNKEEYKTSNSGATYSFCSIPWAVIILKLTRFSRIVHSAVNVI